jgi:hypothetical protein
MDRAANMRCKRRRRGKENGGRREKDDLMTKKTRVPATRKRLMPLL